jgi:hypothetical protein
MGLLSGDTFAAIFDIPVKQVIQSSHACRRSDLSYCRAATNHSNHRWATAFDKRGLVIGLSMTFVLFGIAAVLVWRALARLPERNTSGKKYPACCDGLRMGHRPLDLAYDAELVRDAPASSTTDSAGWCG